MKFFSNTLLSFQFVEKRNINKYDLKRMDFVTQNLMKQKDGIILGKDKEIKEMTDF